MAAVLAVMRASTSPGSIVNVFGSTSAKTGVASWCSGASPLALGVRDELAAVEDAEDGLPVLLGDDRPLDAAPVARNGGRPAERGELRRSRRRRGRHRLSTARAT